MKTRIRNRIVVITLIILCSINYGYSQNEKPNDDLLNKNAIYGNIGTWGLYFTATGYYERMLKQHMWNKNISSFVKIGYGAEAHWVGEGIYLLAQYGLLTGAKTHHLEIGLGPIFYKGDLKGIPPLSGNVGWRIQKPGGNFIFRMGVAWPEAFYLGLGFSF